MIRPRSVVQQAATYVDESAKESNTTLQDFLRSRPQILRQAPAQNPSSTIHLEESKEEEEV